MAKDSPSVQARSRLANVLGRRLAYRTFGVGTPIVLCIRFRGTMDSWDPLFLDSLAAPGFSVTIFDYSGLGASTGEPTYQPASLARDAIDLMDALGLERAVVGGWSVGGIAAQLVMAQVPQRVSHLVLIATTPPGQLVKTGEPLFYRLAGRENDFEDFLSVFFEPASPESARRGDWLSRETMPAQRCRSNGLARSSVKVRAIRCFPSRQFCRPFRRPRFRSCISAATTTSCFRLRTGMR